MFVPKINFDFGNVQSYTSDAPAEQSTALVEVINNATQATFNTLGKLSISNSTGFTGAIDGSLYMENCSKCGKINVNGHAQISNSEISELVITGTVKITQSTVDLFTMKGNSLTIHNSKIDTLLFLHNGAFTLKNKKHQFPEPTIYLDNSSIGNITFYGCSGKVVLTNNAEITGDLSYGQIVILN